MAGSGNILSAAGSYVLTFEDGSGKGEVVVEATISGSDKTLSAFPA